MNALESTLFASTIILSVAVVILTAYVWNRHFKKPNAAGVMQLKKPNAAGVMQQLEDSCTLMERLVRQLHKIDRMLSENIGSKSEPISEHAKDHSNSLNEQRKQLLMTSKILHHAFYEAIATNAKQALYDTEMSNELMDVISRFENGMTALKMPKEQ